MDNKPITQQIKELRKQAGLTQKDFCTMYGIPRRTLEDWDRGQHEPPDYFARLLIQHMQENLFKNKVG